MRSLHALYTNNTTVSNSTSLFLYLKAREHENACHLIKLNCLVDSRDFFNLQINKCIRRITGYVAPWNTQNMGPSSYRSSIAILQRSNFSRYYNSNIFWRYWYNFPLTYIEIHKEYKSQITVNLGKYIPSYQQHFHEAHNLITIVRSSDIDFSSAGHTSI